MESYFAEFDESCYSKAIKMLGDPWQKCILLQRDYVKKEKLLHMQKLVFSLVGRGIFIPCSTLNLTS